AVPAPVRKIDARLRVLKGERRPLAHWAPVHVHLGAMDVTGRAAMLEVPAIAPGDSGLVQLVLDRPIGALHGDRFIVRDQSSRRTIGGGRVIDIFPPRRGRAKPERLAWLSAMEGEAHEAALASLLDQASGGLNLSRFCANRNLTADEAASLFGHVSMHTVATDSGLLGFSRSHWDGHRIAVLDALEAWHKRAPQSPGAPEDRVLDGSGTRLARQALAAIVAELVREGAIARSDASVRLPSHKPAFSGAEAVLWQKIAPLLRSTARLPPLVREIAQAIGERPETTEAALQSASRYGLVFRVSPNRFLLPANARSYAEMAQELARRSADGRFAAAAFRDRSGIGRNLAFEVLEFFDRVKFTRRVGNAREILKPAEEAFAGDQTPPPG
ncbi:MAG: SelB C-terminal domain-containing protein, partial [Betaproteobacteria bacterium]|nr:SelB C-terminal domain-containing protein [Betaproteobacteria bacterium]